MFYFYFSALIIFILICVNSSILHAFYFAAGISFTYVYLLAKNQFSKKKNTVKYQQKSFANSEPRDRNEIIVNVNNQENRKEEAELSRRNEDPTISCREDPLPHSLTEAKYSKNETTSYFNLLFGGNLEKKIIRNVKIETLQEFYNVCFAYFSVRKFKPTRLVKNPDKENEKSNEDAIYNRKLKEAKNNYNTALSNNKNGAKHDLTTACWSDWQVALLIKMYKTGVKIDDLSVIFGIPLAKIKLQLITLGIYVKEISSIDKFTRDRKETVAIFNEICEILDLEQREFNGLKDLDVESLTVILQILKKAESTNICNPVKTFG